MRVVLLSLVMACSDASAGDPSQFAGGAAYGVQLEMRFGDGRKPAFLLNGVPLGNEVRERRLTCPPPESGNSCALPIAVMAVASVVMVAVIVAATK